MIPLITDFNPFLDSLLSVILNLVNFNNRDGGLLLDTTKTEDYSKVSSKVSNFGSKVSI